MGPTRRDGDLQDESNSNRRTRRRYLAGLAVAGSVAIAGCGGGGGGDDDENGDDGATNGTSDPTTGGDTGSEGGGESSSGCPGEFTFVTQGYSALGNSGYVGQCEIPESAQIRSGGGEGSMDSQVTVVHEYANREYTSISLRGNVREDRNPTVDSVLQSHRETADQVDWVEVTGQYDLAVDGARVIASSEDPVPTSTAVACSHPAGVLLTNVDADSSGCQSAAERFYVRVVESIEPA